MNCQLCQKKLSRKTSKLCFPCYQKKRSNDSFVSKKCLFCNEVFHPIKAEINRGGGKFCDKKCFGSFYSSSKNPNWNGGQTEKNGYVLIYKPNHPNCTNRGYVSQHRLVVEKSLKRFLKKDEVVHHKNNDRKDNRIENLEIMTQNEHMRFHNPSGFRKL